jgi:hypothetical protein
MTSRTPGTVTYLTAGMDSPWTAKDKWTNSTSSCPQPDHTCLGQAIKWTSALTTATWITARLDTAVTHTDPSDYGEVISFFLGKKKKENKRTKKRILCIRTTQTTTRSLHKNERHRLGAGSNKFDTQGHPWQKTKSASLRSDAIAVANVIAMSWIG